MLRVVSMRRDDPMRRREGVGDGAAAPVIKTGVSVGDRVAKTNRGTGVGEGVGAACGSGVGGEDAAVHPARRNKAMRMMNTLAGCRIGVAQS